MRARLALLGIALLGAALGAAAAAPSFPGGGIDGGGPRLRPTLVQDQPGTSPPVRSGGDVLPFEIVPGLRPAMPATSEPRPMVPVAFAPDRYLLPFAKLRLSGEIDRRAWAIFLTDDEATLPATVSIGYINAVLVMPEASRLRLTVNGQTVIEAPISSSTGIERIQAGIRPGILRSGQNLVQIEAVQRHRTDCDVKATYELWTDIVPSESGLSFAGRLRNLRGVQDLPAVGVDATGATNLRFVVAGGVDTNNAGRIFRLAQALALRGRYPHPIVSLADTPFGPQSPGTVAVLLGPTAALATLLGGTLPEAAKAGEPAFANDPRLAAPTLVVAGTGAAEIDRLIADIEAPAMRPVGIARRVLDTAAWRAPDVPFFTQASSVRLAELGIATEEFSGRRFRTRFGIGLPSDFYARAYGEGTLYLDAAYTPEVLPTSSVAVIVNGEVAATVDLASRHGGIFRRTPITVPFRHFHAGVNDIVIEATIHTASDARCLPGATLPGVARFVLFDSTEFSVPSFARIGQLPELSALGATGFPYNLGNQEIALLLGRTDRPTISAAGTLLSRIARDAGRPLRTAAVSGLAGAEGKLAIMVGTAEQLPAGLLPQVGVTERIRTDWSTAGAGEPPTTSDGLAEGYDAVLQRFRQKEAAKVGEAPIVDTGPEEDVYDRWRDELGGGGGWRGWVGGFENWLDRTFDISFESLRIGRGADTLFEPSGRVSLLLAQGNAASGPKLWTVLAARSPEALLEDTAHMTDPEIWSRIGGRITAFLPATRTLQIQPVENTEFFPTQPLGLHNARLVAANWMSSNILVYALGLALSCVLLGLGTFAWVRGMGRPS